MANEDFTINEQNTITEKLLNDYLNTITDKLTLPQRMQFIAVATAFGLNPFKREIYAATYKNKDGGTTMSIVTGYEVYLKRAEMNPNYDGFETEFHVVDKQINCTCKVYRKDRRMPITSCVWMCEYNTGKSLWATKPKTMLEKVAIATAFRRAFPTDFGGTPYTTDELPEKMTGDAANGIPAPEIVQAEVITPTDKKTHAERTETTAADTQDQRDANWIAMCEELRSKAPEAFDAYLTSHNVPELSEIRDRKQRHELFAELTSTVNAATQEAG